VTDLHNIVVKKLSDDLNKLILNAGHTPKFGSAAEKDGMWGQFTDRIVLVLEAPHYFSQNSRGESEIDLISLMEVLINFLKDLLDEYIVLGGHLSTHFVVLEFSISKSEGALG
jgi:hypothetical protein